jgi:hypothetical protein
MFSLCLAWILLAGLSSMLLLLLIELFNATRTEFQSSLLFIIISSNIVTICSDMAE